MKEHQNKDLPADIKSGGDWYDTLIQYMTIIMVAASMGIIMWGGAKALIDSIKRARGKTPSAAQTSMSMPQYANNDTIDYKTLLANYWRAHKK